MKWLNFEIPRMRSEPFAGATNEQLGTWLRLIIFCCEQENDGVIPFCANWSDRQWSTCAGLEKAEVLAPSPLWLFRENGSLYVSNFPHEKLTEIVHKRIAANRTNEKRWGKKMKRKYTLKKSLSDSLNGSLSEVAERVGKGRE
jgi:hypothetical protein